MTICSLCDDEPGAYVVSVEMRATDRVAVPASMLFGEECHRLFEVNRDSELAARMTVEFDDYGGANFIITHIRDRVTGVRKLPAPPAAVQKARSEGYELLSEHTGYANEVGAIWPPELRISRIDIGDVLIHDDDDTWLVTSPWQDVSVADIVVVLLDEIESRDAWDDQNEWARVASEVFSWNERRMKGRI